MRKKRTGYFEFCMKKPKKPWRSWAQRCAANEARVRKMRACRIKRIKGIYQIYKRNLSLVKTGEELGLTRERVRQLLEYGHAVKAIIYLGRDTRRLLELFETIDRAELIRDIESALPRAEICSKYGILASLLEKLLECAVQGRDLAGI